MTATNPVRLFISPFDLLDGGEQVQYDPNTDGVYLPVSMSAGNAAAANIQIPLVRSISSATGARVNEVDVLYKVEQGVLANASGAIKQWNYFANAPPATTYLDTTNQDFLLNTNDYTRARVILTNPAYWTSSDPSVLVLEVGFAATSDDAAAVRMLGFEVFYDQTF